MWVNFSKLLLEKAAELLFQQSHRPDSTFFSPPLHEMTLDLRNNTITVGELLDNRASRSVFQRRFGKFMNHPLVGASRSLTLAQLAEMAAVWLPQRTIQETIQELRQL